MLTLLKSGTMSIAGAISESTTSKCQGTIWPTVKFTGFKNYPRCLNYRPWIAE